MMRKFGFETFVVVLGLDMATKDISFTYFIFMLRKENLSFRIWFTVPPNMIRSANLKIVWELLRCGIEILGLGERT